MLVIGGTFLVICLTFLLRWVWTAVRGGTHRPQEYAQHNGICSCNMHSVDPFRQQYLQYEKYVQLVQNVEHVLDIAYAQYIL